ncbi:MAG: hypothetical protein D6710_10810 [Nitrospirae bacterium]|nr:MAG: hypothetical protein D6710_10810 [Nitrospirota bacterium]
MEMKKYLLKEYGSWAVALTAYLIGIKGLISVDELLAGAFACFFIINSKEAFSKWLRSYRFEPALIFFAQMITGSVVILFIVGRDFTAFLPFLFIPVLYLLLFRFKGEHFILTEVFGFMVLTLSVLPSCYITTGRVGYELYLIVSLFFFFFFFKVRMQLRKDNSYRIVSLLYLFLVFIIYTLFIKKPILGLPLLENLYFTLRPYRVRLKHTGWIELLKSLLFLLLIKGWAY